MIGDEIKIIVENIDPDFPNEFKSDVRLVLNVLLEQINIHCETISAMQLVNDQLNIDIAALHDDVSKSTPFVTTLMGS